MNREQYQKIREGDGFIAALDQSGGSTPKALEHYGIPKDAWSGDDEMFDLVHEMRTRIVTSPAFGGDRILAAILFEGTMDRDIKGVPSPEYLWKVKHVVPFLKIDKGLADAADGVQMMKRMKRGSTIWSPAPTMASRKTNATAFRCGRSHRR